MVTKVIEWYETDRDKVKEAQKAIDDFSLSDSIDDLENAKEKESQLLQDSIDDWDDYLDMLESRYEEYDRLEQQKLLMELLGVSSEEEVQNIIKSDMLDFTEYMKNNTQAFLSDQITAYNDYNSSFDQFLDDYEESIERYHALQESAIQTISASSYTNKNNAKADLVDTALSGNNNNAAATKKEEVKEETKTITTVATAAATKAATQATTKQVATGEKTISKVIGSLLTEKEFSSSSAMQAQYGNYSNYKALLNSGITTLSGANEYLATAQQKYNAAYKYTQDEGVGEYELAQAKAELDKAGLIVSYIQKYGANVYKTITESATTDTSAINSAATYTPQSTDYSLLVKSYMDSGNYSSAVNALLERQNKITEKGLEDSVKSNEDLIQELKDSGQYTSDEINKLTTTYLNIQTAQTTLTKEGNDTNSKTSKFIESIAGNTSTTLTSNQIKSISTAIENTGILSDDINNVGDLSTSTIEAGTESLTEQLASILGVSEAIAEGLVQQGLVNAQVIEEERNIVAQWTSSDGLDRTLYEGDTYSTGVDKNGISFSNGKAEAGLSVGTVVTGDNGHTWTIDSVNSDGSYNSTERDENGNVVTKHTGMDSGLVGDIPLDKSKEVIVKALKGEGVFTDDQMDAIANALGLLEDITPVDDSTYTSLYSLTHGISSTLSPAADNLLNYMNTKRPEFESTISGSGDTIYDFGGITMNEVNSAEEFFKDLNSAMSNRHNITKNTRR